MGKSKRNRSSTSEDSSSNSSTDSSNESTSTLGDDHYRPLGYKDLDLIVDRLESRLSRLLRDDDSSKRSSRDIIKIHKTYTVCLGDKKDHPWRYRIKGRHGFQINGHSGRLLRLKRNKSYRFTLQQSPDDKGCYEHQLFFTEDPMGGIDFFSDKPSKLRSTPDPFSHGSHILTIDKDTPAIFYYQCRNHEFMGGIVMIEG